MDYRLGSTVLSGLKRRLGVLNDVQACGGYFRILIQESLLSQWADMASVIDDDIERSVLRVYRLHFVEIDLRALNDLDVMRYGNFLFL